jgi:opacity protein-like surface antigen
MRKYAFGAVAVMLLFTLAVASPAFANDDKASSSTTNTATTLSTGLSAPNPAPTPARKARTHSAPDPDRMFNGFSLGGSFGYVQGNGDTIFNPLPNASSFFDLLPQTLVLHPHGVIGGLRAGYDHQHRNWVFGLTADFSGTGVTANTMENPIINFEGLPDSPAGGTDLTAKAEMKFLSTIRGRAGFVVDKRVLFYVTGGLAWGRFIFGADTNYHPDFEEDYLTDISRIKVGWTVGAGIEYAVHRHWHAGVEYLYYEFPSESKVANPVPANPPVQVFNNWAAFGQIAQGVVTYNFK